MENTVTVNGTDYLIGEMSAFDQFHVGRKLAPLLGGALEVLGGSLDIGSGFDKDKGLDLLVVAGPKILQALSEMSDEHSEYVIRKCLAVVQRRQTNGWARVMNSSGVLMFQDLRLKDMLTLTVHVVKGNLADFFPTGQPNSEEAE